MNYWEQKLCAEASVLSSLTHFKPAFMSLTRPHRIYSTAGASPYEVTKACIQGVFLSGRYRTELLCRHWSSNTEGYCQLPLCSGMGFVEDIDHIFIHCNSLSLTRERLSMFTQKYAMNVPSLSSCILKLTTPNHPQYTQFLIDCSTIPEVICLAQQLGEYVYDHFFKISRTWCYSLHRERLRLLGRWSTQ